MFFSTTCCVLALIDYLTVKTQYSHISLGNYPLSLHWSMRAHTLPTEPCCLCTCTHPISMLPFNVWCDVCWAFIRAASVEGKIRGFAKAFELLSINRRFLSPLFQPVPHLRTSMYSPILPNPSRRYNNNARHLKQKVWYVCHVSCFANPVSLCFLFLCLLIHLHANPYQAGLSFLQTAS